MVIDLIGVPFDGMGRRPGQGRAPAALRADGAAARRIVRLVEDVVIHLS